MGKRGNYVGKLGGSEFLEGRRVGTDRGEVVRDAGVVSVELAAFFDPLVDGGQYFASDFHFREDVLLDAGFLEIRFKEAETTSSFSNFDVLNMYIFL